MIEVIKCETEFFEVFHDYDNLFPEYKHEGFYWRLIWEGAEERDALFTRLDAVEERFGELLRTVAQTELDAEAERKGIKKFLASQAGQAGDKPAQERQEKEKGLVLETPQRSNEASEEYDVFLCHASEDKKSFVRPLAEALRKKGLRVWYDEFSLKLGNRLCESIEGGLNKSRYGVIVLSKDFFRKKWPREELNGLLSLESGEKKILPVWHGVNEKEVKSYSLILANRVAIETSKGPIYVAEKIIEVVRSNAPYKLP
ncbi:MAG TPA: toll/interleukin-1 receptor domain-containing protein [Candidatus Tripitaka californicus]|uniref:toll/interleukin-1 receptor domain-containing protein n=1 Tax=Candidatus Tripitaka californicus TaxID=3367616 RepID=UPI004025F89B|nr:toll/interleukin-1 receptor domain-containing protein [Planctomycetota bacterium]